MVWKLPDIPLLYRGLQSLSGVSGDAAACTTRMLNSHPDDTVYNYVMPRIDTGEDARFLVTRATSAPHYKKYTGKIP